MREARRREGRRGRLPERKEGGGGMSAGTTPKRKAARDFQGFRKVEQRLAPPPFMEEA